MDNQLSTTNNNRPPSRHNRRDFLIRSAMGATALACSGRSALGEVAANDKMTLGVVGCGGISRHHAPRLPQLFNVRSVCELDRLRGEQYLADFAPQAQLYSEYEDLVNDDQLDALLICTPDHWHAKIAAEAMLAGKDVYCEKPLTLTIDEGEKLRRVAQQTGRVLQVGTQQRSSTDFQTAVALAHEGRAGKLKRVTAAIGAGPVGGPFSAEPVPEHLNWDRWLGPAPEVEYRPQRCHGNFRWWYEYSGGKMTDWGAHHVDIALWGACPDGVGDVQINPLAAVHSPELIDGMPSTADHYNTAATFHIRCQLDNGVELDIRDTAPDLGFENGILFECEEGRFFVNRGKLTGRVVEELGEKPLPEETLMGLRKGRAPSDHFANFFHACHDRGQPISDVDSHVQHLNVCHAANIAIRLGQQLAWRTSTASFSDSNLTKRWASRARRPGYEI